MQAAIDGGFKNVEFTLTTPGCLGDSESICIRFLTDRLLYLKCTLQNCSDCVADFRKKHDGKVLVGCGTVMDVEDAQRALEAGAEFIVCPILIPEVGLSSSSKQILCIVFKVPWRTDFVDQLRKLRVDSLMLTSTPDCMIFLFGRRERHSRHQQDGTPAGDPTGGRL
jgi:hypothetical protein